MIMQKKDFLMFRIDRESKAIFNLLCKGKGKTMSEVLLAYVQEKIKKG